MNAAIENMMKEHRLIVQVLGALDSMAQRLQQTATVPREDVARFATFFREYADQHHHAKEEQRLFVQMEQSGFPREYGPVGVMLAEHDAGRGHVRALGEIGRGTAALTPEETQAVVGHAAEFLPLLLGHIQKEDNVLYPMAQEALTPAALQQLDADCQGVDQQAVADGHSARLEDLAADLIRRYPPDPSRLAAAQSCLGCAGHH